MNIHSLHEDYFCLRQCAKECDVCYGITRVDAGERFERTGCGCFTLDAPPSESCAGDQWPKQCAESCWRCAPCYHPLTKADFYPEIRFHPQGHGDFCDGQCGAWQGDCDFDADCRPGLVCGLNNCPQGLINTYLNSRGKGDVHPDAPAHLEIADGYTTMRLPDCCIYPGDRMSGGRKGDSLAWGNYQDYTKQDFGPWEASMAVGPEVTAASVGTAIGATAGSAALLSICGLMYWYCVRPRRHKRGRKYLPDLAQPGFAPAEAKRGWGSLSEVDTQAGSERAETPMDLSMSRGSDLKFSGPRDRRAAEEIPLRELTKSQRRDSRRDAPRRRDADELPAAGVLQSPGPSSPPKLPTRYPAAAGKPSLPAAFPEALVEAQKPAPPPPPPLPARFQQPMRDSLSPSQSSQQSSPQRERRISAGARQARPASDTMSETGRTEMSDLTVGSVGRASVATSTASRGRGEGAAARNNRREVTQRRSRREMERLQEERRLEDAGIDEEQPRPTVVTAANVRSPAGRTRPALGSPAGSTPGSSAPSRPAAPKRLPAAPPQLQHY